jgi:hypothetical protein
MKATSPSPELIRGEATSMIHWGTDAQEVIELLQKKYEITAEEAKTMVIEALAIRKSHVRKKAMIGLAFAVMGLAIPVTYFVIQRSVGFIVIGFGPILMILFGMTSLAFGGRCLVRIFSGEGPA